MDYFLAIPDDLFKYQLITYMNIIDICSIDNATRCHKYREQLLDKFSNIIIQDLDDFKINNNVIDCSPMSISFLQWLAKRSIFLKNFSFSLSSSSLSSYHIFVKKIRNILYVKNNNIFKHTSKLSISFNPNETYFGDGNEFISAISCYCIQLEVISIYDCDMIIDNSIITIVTHCTKLKSIILDSCYDITDASLVAISLHCPRIQHLHLYRNQNITDVGILSIINHCSILISIEVDSCTYLSDISMNAIAKNCPHLEVLDIGYCPNISNEAIVHLIKSCNHLITLDLSGSKNLSDETIILLSTHCKKLKELDISSCNNITDVGITTMIMNSSSHLRYVSIYGCRNITVECYRSMIIHQPSVVIESIYCRL